MDLGKPWIKLESSEGDEDEVTQEIINAFKTKNISLERLEGTFGPWHNSFEVLTQYGDIIGYFCNSNEYGLINEMIYINNECVHTTDVKKVNAETDEDDYLFMPTSKIVEIYAQHKQVS